METAALEASPVETASNSTERAFVSGRNRTATGTAATQICGDCSACAAAPFCPLLQLRSKQSVGDTLGIPDIESEDPLSSETTILTAADIKPQPPTTEGKAAREIFEQLKKGKKELSETSIEPRPPTSTKPQFQAETRPKPVITPALQPQAKAEPKKPTGVNQFDDTNPTPTIAEVKPSLINRPKPEVKVNTSGTIPTIATSPISKRPGKSQSPLNSVTLIPKSEPETPIIDPDQKPKPETTPKSRQSGFSEVSLIDQAAVQVASNNHVRTEEATTKNNVAVDTKATAETAIATAKATAKISKATEPIPPSIAAKYTDRPTIRKIPKIREDQKTPRLKSPEIFIVSPKPLSRKPNPPKTDSAGTTATPTFNRVQNGTANMPSTNQAVKPKNLQLDETPLAPKEDILPDTEKAAMPTIETYVIAHEEREKSLTVTESAIFMVPHALRFSSSASTTSGKDDIESIDSVANQSTEAFNDLVSDLEPEPIATTSADDPAGTFTTTTLATPAETLPLIDQPEECTDADQGIEHLSYKSKEVQAVTTRVRVSRGRLQAKQLSKILFLMFGRTTIRLIAGNANHHETLALLDDECQIC